MDFIGHIRPVNINEEMRSSYLDYAMSVIVARALPDARDGLKPVHRRILYAMYEMGIRANSSYKKSARIVGEVLGKYHPHGDSAVYDAMARMAQDFSLRYPLVDGQGNFGSIDGDSPAAMRYTEARLARIAEEMLVDIDMNTVDFVDNYDGTQQEPTVLPARLPNMLLNGASGIAVGMATNIPPHNLRELAGAIVYLIDRWEAIDEITIDELIQFVKGPDFPTGAQVIANEALKEAYATGRGHIFVRARIENEIGKNDRHRLVITEIPYQVSKTAIIERIVALVKEDKITQVADLRDESDRQGMRLVVELKHGANPDTARKQLLKYTQLQSTYGIQMLALVNGEPRTLSLKRMLQIYVEHRYEIIVRRSQFELEKRRARAHILEGLLKALSSLDAIIQTIRSADDADDARAKLIGRFGLSEAQSNAILEMQLRRLAALEQLKLQQEYQEVSARIAYLEDLLASPAKILAVIRQDVVELADSYGDARRTEIVYGESAELSDYDLIKKEEVVILMTQHGYIKRVPATAYRAQRRGGKGVIGMTTREEDDLCDVLAASSHDTLLFLSDRGKVYSTPAFNVPEAGRASKGVLVHSVIAIGSDEKITAIVPVDSFDKQGYFVLATRNGRIKRVELEEFAEVRPSGLIAISLEDGDRLQWASYTDGDQDVMIVTSRGQAIRFHERQVRAMGRQAGGVRSIRLHEDDTVAGMDVIEAEDTHMLVVTQNGYGKRTPLDAYREQGRFGMGMRTLARDERTGPIVKMCCINPSDDILIMTRGGAVLRTQLEQIREVGRSAIGVRLINLEPGDQVVGIAIMASSDQVNGVYLSDSEMEAMTIEGDQASRSGGNGAHPADDAGSQEAAD
jgi:DNA gyrase subunit A